MAVATAGETTAAHPDFPDQEILDFVVSEETLKVVVERTSHPLPLGHVDAENSYFLPSSGTKGFALILNIIRFDKESYRKGSLKDVNYLSDLLTQLDYKLYPESKAEREMPRKSMQEMQNFIQEFISRCNEEQPESAIVFLGSHGKHPNLISTSDSKSLDLYRDIVNEFSHEKCPGLKGKPKMFFVQACQLYPKVRQTATTTLPVESQEEPEISSVMVEEGDERIENREIIQLDSKDNPLWRPTIEDVLICTAVMPGQGAQRDPHKGSWFPYCLTYIMMRYALKMRSLQNMLEMVDKMLEKIKAVGAAVQVPVVTRLKFKTLYFSGIPVRNLGENLKKYNKLPPGLRDFTAGVGLYAKWTVIVTVSSHATCGKIRDNLDNCRFVEWEEFSLSLSESDENAIEIVTNCTMRNLKRLNKVDLGGSGGSRKVVLVICEDEQKVKDLVEELAPWKSGVELSADGLAWEDLTLAHQDELNEKLKNDYDIELENATLNGKLLADIITGEEIKLFKDTLPEQLSYYVGRTVLTRNIISNKIFNRDTTCPDIFLISGVDRYQLSSLVKDETTGNSTDYLRGRTQAKFLALDKESPAHLERILKYCTVPTHLLDYGNGRLRWRKSKGELAVIRKYVDNESQEELKETDFCSGLASDSTSPICISDGPGMGKSVLLAECGRKLSQLFPERLVFYVVLREIVDQEHFRKLKIGNTSVNVGAVGNILREMFCENIIGETVLMSRLKCEDQIAIELLLDGLDEVDTPDAKTVRTFMNVIRTSYKSVRLWITTRPHLIWGLENNLKVLGYNIQPFREEDQVQFLTTFWVRGRPELEDKTQQFARHCLKSLKEKMNSVDQDIAGIPLLCLLIGEVYEEEAMEFGESDITCPSNCHIEIASVTKLYENMIDNRMVKYKTLFGQSKPTDDSQQNEPGLFSKLLQICIWRRFQRSSETSKRKEHLSEHKLKEMHAGLALAEIFPGYLAKLEGLIVPAEMDDIFRVGIVAASNSTHSPKFIHRTFAEYFVAWFVTDKLTRNEKWTEELINFLFELVLGSQIKKSDIYPDYVIPKQHGFFRQPPYLVEYFFSRPVLCYFLNTMLNDSVLADIPGVVTNSLSSSGVSVDTMKEIAAACICSDFVNIFKLFVESKVWARFQADIFDLAFLLKAVEKSSWELIKVMISHLEQSSPSNSNWKEKALGFAVYRGEFSIVEFLVKEQGLRETVQGLGGESGGAIELMSMLLLNSKWRAESIVEQKRQVLRMLATINPGLLQAKVPQRGESPLLLGLRDNVNANVELLLELVSLGADVLIRTQEDQTVLHLSNGRNHLSKMDYHRLLMRIHTDKLRILGQVKNKDGDTPLMTLVSFMDPDADSDPDPETLEMLLVTGSDFNCINNDGYSALALAVKYGRSKLTIVKLLSCMADSKWRGRKGESIIHVAAEYGHVVAAKILVDEYGLDPTVVDDEGLSPLDYAVKSDCDYGVRYKTGLAIHQMGGKLKEDYPWLHVAAREGNLDSVMLLLRLEVNANGLDSQGNTPLHLTFTKACEGELGIYGDHIDIAKHLLEKGADPTILNELGETALHTGLKNDELTITAFRLLWSETHIAGMSSSCATLALPFVVLGAVNVIDDAELMIERVTRKFKKPRLVFSTDLKDEGESSLESELGTAPETTLHYLIEEKGAHVNWRAKATKETLLHKAALGRNKDVNLKIIKYLIEHGADVDEVDSQNQTFLHTYISWFLAPSPSNFHELVEFLLTRNCSYSSLFHIPAVEDGQTPLHLAMCYLEPLEETLELLHSNGVHFNDIDGNGNSLFAYAIMGEQRKELLSFLVGHGADHKYINTGTKCNMLHIAVEAGNLQALKFLHEVGGVNVNDVDGNGCTPLDIARRNGRGRTMAEWLVKNGAVALKAWDPTFKSKSKARNMNMRRYRV